MRRTFAGTVAVCVALACPVGGQDAAQAARTWRQAHERQIVADYLDFLRLPNVAKDSGHLRQNADAIMKAMAARGLNPRLLTVPDAPPVVYGELVAPHPTHTYVLYAHYDGQPVDPAQWATPPFEPVVRAGRLDKGAAIVALPFFFFFFFLLFFVQLRLANSASVPVKCACSFTRSISAWIRATSFRPMS